MTDKEQIENVLMFIMQDVVNLIQTKLKRLLITMP